MFRQTSIEPGIVDHLWIPNDNFLEEATRQSKNKGL